MGDDTEVNTKYRWAHNCKAVNPANGDKCSLYDPHEGGHKPKNGTQASRWSD